MPSLLYGLMEIHSMTASNETSDRARSTCRASLAPPGKLGLSMCTASMRTASVPVLLDYCLYGLNVSDLLQL